MKPTGDRCSFWEHLSPAGAGSKNTHPHTRTHTHSIAKHSKTQRSLPVTGDPGGSTCHRQGREAQTRTHTHIPHIAKNISNFGATFDLKSLPDTRYARNMQGHTPSFDKCYLMRCQARVEVDSLPADIPTVQLKSAASTGR